MRLELGAGLDGRRRRLRRGGFRTRKAAEEALARLRGPKGKAITVGSGWPGGYATIRVPPRRWPGTPITSAST
ncbi:hypothetical protein E1293_45740 [Actinomadura darangshiensis]|uniref:AP2-like integrase N-terminal domain-containing protein n=1 Tax=Actinomadura darangshiensis TaxID=705336 RepID=A0A4R4ZQH0_9ACTN|nr:hypothetical protein E1293_45740 [Actinomadura darangshiensis]